jgi:hypothetical protein
MLSSTLCFFTLILRRCRSASCGRPTPSSVASSLGRFAPVRLASMSAEASTVGIEGSSESDFLIGLVSVARGACAEFGWMKVDEGSPVRTKGEVVAATGWPMGSLVPRPESGLESTSGLTSPLSGDEAIKTEDEAIGSGDRATEAGVVIEAGGVVSAGGVFEAAC